MNEEQTYFNACNEMLKDTGIKTKIIKEYLPVMNSIVNKYLQILDFFVDFNIDENFNETIRSRYRDAFSYSSFSEGEKMKIDISLLFAWRQIAKLKNSASTNLLILDETFDSSLDQDSVDNLMKIMDTLGMETNTFIISHKGDMLADKFRSKIEFVKSRNFSVIK
jgi:DNA repair exonuclease SbcCD ATPase subunit